MEDLNAEGKERVADDGENGVFIELGEKEKGERRVHWRSRSSQGGGGKRRRRLGRVKRESRFC